MEIPVSNSPSQSRVPDSRLPGAEALAAEEAGRKQAESQQQQTTDSNGVEWSTFLALWPLFMLLSILVTLAVATAWYGPTKVIQAVLSFLLPSRPTTWDMFAIWASIVLCTTLGIPVLMLLLAVPAMMFGFWKGFMITAAGELSAACLSFVIGRYIAQRPVRRFLDGQGFKRIMRMLHVLEDDEDQSMQLLILYRFIMMPMACRNYGPAILQVPIWKLVVAAIPHVLWSGIVFATIGSSLKGSAELIRDGHQIAWRTPQWQQVAGVVIALISAALFSWIAYRAYNRRVESEEVQTALKGSAEGSARLYGTNPELMLEARDS